jgi:hypothetical protein
MTPMFVILAKAGMTTIYVTVKFEAFVKTLKHNFWHFDQRDKS